MFYMVLSIPVPINDMFCVKNKTLRGAHDTLKVIKRDMKNI